MVMGNWHNSAGIKHSELCDTDLEVLSQVVFVGDNN